MPGETSPHRQERRKYTLVFIPGDESNATKTFSLGRIGIIALLASVSAVIAVVVILILVFTPLGAVLPIGHPELEEQYRGKVLQIQEQLNSLMGEMVFLRSYNVRLRKALGEKELVDTPGYKIDEGGSGTVPEDVLPSRGVRTESLQNPTVHQTAMDVVGRNGIEFPFIQPVQGYVTKAMNPDEGHFGIDVAGSPGTHVIAPAEGRVVFADWSYDFGFMMIVNHAKGYSTVYKHNQSLVKTVGASVKRGEVIAFLGNTGVLSSGPHLHFELWKDGVPEDPELYLLNVQ